MSATWDLSRIQFGTQLWADTTNHETAPVRETACLRTWYTSMLSPPKWPEHWLDSLPNTFTFYKIASRGLGSVISTPAPFDTQHVSHSACSYQKEWFHIIKRQCQALLEAWLPHIQKIRAGSPVGVLRQELSPCTKVSVNVVRNPNTAMSEISLFFFFWPPLLFPPCQGLELLNSIPGAVLTFICLSTAPWYRERDHFYSNT